MEFDFQDWLHQCYKENCLTKDEIDECLEDPIKSYYLFIEYLECDKIDTGEYVQEELRRFKIAQARSLKGWPHNR